MLVMGGILSISSNASSIKELNKIRENYFENNMPFDSNYVKKSIKSRDSVISTYAKGLLGTYYIQNSNINGDTLWRELIFKHKILLKNKSSEVEEFLLIDDLFRVCMTLNKYYFFMTFH